MLPPAPDGLRIEVPVLDKSAHGAVVTAAVSWFGGTIALLTFLLNREQKERHNSDLARRERDLAELQRLESEFSALVEAFSSSSVQVRANAAIGLGEIATKPDPRRVNIDGTFLPDSRRLVGFENESDTEYDVEWPSALRSAKTEINFPYFMRVINRLSCALYQWPEYECRSEAVRVLDSLSKWASDGSGFGTDEPLLHELLNRIAESNRTAWWLLQENFTKAVQLGATASELYDILALEARIPNDRFQVSSWRRHESALCLELQEGKLSSPMVQIAANWLEKPKFDRELRERFRVAALCFFDTGLVFAQAARKLNVPPELEVEGILVAVDARLSNLRHTWFEWEKKVIKTLVRKLVSRKIPELGIASFAASPSWLEKRRGLHFEGIRLFGAELQGVNFHGAIMDLAVIEWSDLSAARFGQVGLEAARLRHCICRGTSFEKVFSPDADFAGSIMRGTSFAKATCDNANCEFLACVEVNFTNAMLSKADFSGVTIESSNFSSVEAEGIVLVGATLTGNNWKNAKIAGAKIGQESASDLASFNHTEFIGADFGYYTFDVGGKLVHNGLEDRDLKKLLLGEE